MDFEYEHPFNMILAGHTKAGKTYLLEQIVKRNFLKWDYIVVLGPTVKFSGDYDYLQVNENYEKGHVVVKYDKEEQYEGIIHSISNQQRHLIDEERAGRGTAPDVLLIIEDCLHKEIVDQRGILAQLVTWSRKIKLSIVLTTQKIAGLDRTIRLNTKYFICFNCPNFTELERFLEEFLPPLYHKAFKKYVCEIFNEKYNFILIDVFNPHILEKFLVNGETNLIQLLQEHESELIDTEPASKQETTEDGTAETAEPKTKKRRKNKTEEN